MALPAVAALLRASTYPNVANAGATAFEEMTRVTDDGTHTAALDAELKLVQDEDGNDVFPSGATTAEADAQEIFEKRPQFLDQFATIVHRYAADV